MSTIKLLLLDPPRNSTEEEREAVLLPKLAELTDGMQLPFGTLAPNMITWRLFVKSTERSPLVLSIDWLHVLHETLAALPNCCLGVPINKAAKVERLLQKLGHKVEVYKA